jgi:hypothetical protein
MKSKSKVKSKSSSKLHAKAKSHSRFKTKLKAKDDDEDEEENKGKDDKGKKSCPGCSPTSAVKACYKVKGLKPAAHSGYYWLNVPCSKNPIRVYCNF